MAQQITRQTAYKIRINDALEGSYIKEEGWNPNYIIDGFGRKVSRANIIAVIVDAPKESDSRSGTRFSIDDGTGVIGAMVFEPSDKIKHLEVGSAVQIIGRIREYNSERYINPEIIKELYDKRWIDVRKLEIQKLEDSHGMIDKEDNAIPNNIAEKESSKTYPETASKIHIQESDIKNQNTKTPEKIMDDFDDKEEDSSATDTSSLLIAAIRELDIGDGADMDEVIEKSGIGDAEKVIKSLLLEGDIFEIRPGRIKVLD